MNGVPSPSNHQQWGVLVAAVVLLAIAVATVGFGGAFGFGVSDTASTAPELTLESTEGTFSDEGYGCRGFHRPYNVTEVRVSHAGGDRLDLTHFEVRVAGNGSVWGVEERDAFGTCGRESVAPAPDVRAFVSQQAPVEFTPGQVLSIVSYRGLAHDNVEPVSYGYDVSKYVNDPCENPPLRIEHGETGVKTNSTLLEQGDRLAVVWQAASGEASQPLLEHEVRQAVPDC
jgi:hypothetical protein